jgi:hypothetical protein
MVKSNVNVNGRSQILKVGLAEMSLHQGIEMPKLKKTERKSFGLGNRELFWKVFLEMEMSFTGFPLCDFPMWTQGDKGKRENRWMVAI